MNGIVFVRVSAQSLTPSHVLVYHENMMFDDEIPFHPDSVTKFIIETDKLRYKFRARTVGHEEWVCPFCGVFTRTELDGTEWVMVCGGCRNRLGVGRVGYIIPRGQRIYPPDLVIPNGLREAFPEGDLARWKSGDTVHMLRNTDTLPRHVPCTRHCCTDSSMEHTRQTPGE